MRLGVVVFTGQRSTSREARVVVDGEGCFLLSGLHRTAVHSREARVAVDGEGCFLLAVFFLAAQ